MLNKNTLQYYLQQSLNRFGHQLAIEYGNKVLTYRELDRRSNYIANWIARKGIPKESLIGILLDDRVELICALIGILKAGCIFVPLDPAHPDRRLAMMINITAARWVITDKLNLNRMVPTRGSEEYAGDNRSKEKLSAVFILLEDLFLEGNEAWFLSPPPIRCSPEDKIYIYFTSGSTGSPKAMLGKNKSLLHFIRWELDTFKITPGFRISQFTSPGFDVFLRDVFAPLCSGGVICIPTTSDTILKPQHLVLWLDHSGINLIHCVPALFRLLNTNNLKGNHFKRLKFILIAGEKIEPFDLIEWFEVFDERIQLVNLWGPSETTLVKTFYFIGKSDVHRERVPVGKPMKGSRVVVLDENLDICKDRTVGELYIRTPYRTFGYCNDPELTQERFIRNPFSNNSNDRLYRTGDLGRLLPDGSIEVLGRNDRQVKIRGIRIELEEIEAVLIRHPLVKEAVVIKKEISANDMFLSAFVTASETNEMDEESLLSRIKMDLQQQLPSYMVPAHIISLGQIPRNLHGKVDYKKLSNIAADGETRYVPPRTEVEERLLSLWTDILKVEKEKISVTTSFFIIGGNSLNGVFLISKIHREFNTKISLADIFINPTIEKQARFIRDAKKEEYDSIGAAEKKEYYTLSSAQKRLYILQQMEPESRAYNMSNLVVLEGELDRKAIERTFRKLINRHESLRISFVLVEGRPVQKVHDHVELQIEYYDLQVTDAYRRDRSRWEEGTHHSSNNQIIHHFIRPFDLSTGPLLRLGLIKFNQVEEKFLLMVDMHHIISDGVSHLILAKDFMALYNGEELPPLKIQHKDFSGWQNRKKQKQAVKQQEEYWVKKFAGDIPVLKMPADYPRPAVQSMEGDVIPFEVNNNEINTLQNLAMKQKTTLYVVLLTVFNVWLSKISGQEDIVIGTPTAGRQHADLEQVMGMFVNTLVMRNFPSSEKTFSQFLPEVKENTLNAFENQDYPFEDLVEQVSVSRDVSRNPLFDVVLVLHNMDLPILEIPGLTLKPYEYERKAAKFDLTLYAIERNEKLSFAFEYCSKLFKKETIHRFISYFKKLVSQVALDPDEKIANMEIIPEQEKKQILYEFNDTTAVYPVDKTIHQLFEAQAEQTPHHTALVGNEGTRGLAPLCITLYITYRELNARANQMARLLIEKGVKPDTIVGLMMERSVEMIVGILGILKAGGAYLPIEPEYPQERIKYMLNDSNAKILVTTPGLSEKFLIVNCQLLIVNEMSYQRRFNNPPQEASSHLRLSPAPVTSLAYIIYTSGTTGQPKGVLIQHQNVVRLLFNDRFQFDFTGSDVWTMFHSYCFDFSVWEMYGSLLYGGKLVLIPKMTARNPDDFRELLKQETVTVLNQTPAAFYHLANVEATCPGKDLRLKYVIFGGEPLAPARLKQWKEKYPGTKLINMYGITETTVHVTYKEIELKDIRLNISNIGKPIPTLSVYVIDKNQKLVPIGAAGELCVGGQGVCRGYLNRPQLTAERFVLAHSSWLIADRKTKQVTILSPLSYIYKSGDLVRLLDNGEMEYLGRIDHQVKIRGFRIELGEIENRLLQYKGIKKVVVTAREKNNADRYLCAYIVSARGYAVPGLRKHLSQTLPDYMIPSYFVFLENIPLTANGKVNRKVLPEPEFKAAEDYAAPRNRIEKILAELWSDILGIESNLISIDANFFEIGGHSLKATILLSQIHKALDIKLPLVEIFRTPTIRELSGYINRAAKTRFAFISPAEQKEYYPLSPAQRRLFFIHQLDSKNLSYNIPTATILEGELNIEKLKEIFKKLMRRHESLRTSFELLDAQPVQKILKEVDLSLEIAAAAVTSEETRTMVKNFIRPFDLDKAPQLRVSVIRQGEASHILMVDMHHIISDFISRQLLIGDFITLYRGEELSPLKLQYKDYSLWQNKRLQQQEIKEQEKYWLNVFKGEIPELNLPTDEVTSTFKTFKGEELPFSIDPQLCDALRKITEETTTTLYMVLLTVFYILLSKYARQEDIVVCSPISGRNHADLENIIGVFVNMLALRNRPERHKTFNEFLAEVKENTLNAFENEDYQFDELVSQLGIKKNTGENPLSEVVFNMLNIENHQENSLEKPDGTSHLKASPYGITDDRTPFNLLLNAREVNNEIYMRFTYAVALFKKTTIEKMTAHYIDIIKQVTEKPGIQLAEIKVSHHLLSVKPISDRSGEAVFHF